MFDVLIVFGLAFWMFNLADRNKKPRKWLYPLLAVLTYFGVSFLTAIVATFIFVALDYPFIHTARGPIVLSIISTPMGAIAVAIVRYMMQRRWSRQKEMEQNLLDKQQKL